MSKDKAPCIDDCRKSFVAILKAIDKTQMADMVPHGFVIERVMDRMAATLDMVREYFILRDGKDADKLPFVQEIDRIVPRKSAAKARKKGGKK